MEFWALTFDAAGKILIAYTALAVHHRFRHEKKIDERVFKAMRMEQLYGFTGMAFILVAYVLKLAIR